MDTDADGVLGDVLGIADPAYSGVDNNVGDVDILMLL